ncbi:hypothetical protein [Luteolibacter sp. LG18]|uniref:hypothetical protein n=1 Tax=Luteolibacter sp. LG18 TaxID=2819286 RepID=UPI002B3214D5|nr:hypothetical protein llg_16530 [Luteolibacter sp. LG18]
MKASVVDLRYRTKEILHALETGESIELTHRGQTKGEIVPVAAKTRSSLADHPAVGMWRDQEEPVEDMVKRLRKPRFHVD